MKRKDFSQLQISVQKEKDSYFEHEDFIAGIAPFLRGIYPTMYFQKPLKTEIINKFSEFHNLDPENELSNFLTTSYRSIKKEIENNTEIDLTLSNYIFHTTIHDYHVDEIAKMRAVRMLWAKMVKLFNPKKQDSIALQIEVSTSNPFSTSVAFLGGAQSLFSKDNSHLFFQNETGITKTVDPWAGSFQLEKRTEEIAYKAWELFKQEVNF